MMSVSVDSYQEEFSFVEDLQSNSSSSRTKDTLQILVPEETSAIKTIRRMFLVLFLIAGVGITAYTFISRKTLLEDKYDALYQQEATRTKTHVEKMLADAVAIHSGLVEDIVTHINNINMDVYQSNLLAVSSLVALIQASPLALANSTFLVILRAAEEVEVLRTTMTAIGETPAQDKESTSIDSLFISEVRFGGFAISTSTANVTT